MATETKTTSTIEFGDFQTPDSLALDVVSLLRTLGLSPAAVLEPSCGQGSFISAAVKAFGSAKQFFGVDINNVYVEYARSAIDDERVRVFEGDFFKLDWSMLLSQSEGPWLILGNPPWVTNSQLGMISSKNLPSKRNDRKLSGVEAITGKSNFDISEWMLLRYLEWICDIESAFAVLCKVTVARKVLAYAWEKTLDLEYVKMFRIDAEQHFGVSVDACLFVVKSGKRQAAQTCDVFDDLQSVFPSETLSHQDGRIIKNLSDYRRGQHLLGVDKNYQWRSGVKHDCSSVMELRQVENSYVNGFGQTVEIENLYLYPMFKSSGLSAANFTDRMMIVPQRYPGEDLSELPIIAPKTWDYLMRNREALRKRGSSIYKNKTDFSIFGVGPYTFAPWKVAISGFYKRLDFAVVGPINERPAVFDDTVYFIPCWSENEATFVAELLNATVTRTLLQSMIHWDSKRPITADLLKRVNLAHIAHELGHGEKYQSFVEAALVESTAIGNLDLFPTTD